MRLPRVANTLFLSPATTANTDASICFTVVLPLLPVMANEGLLTQAVANLFSNGVKFIQTGQTPRLDVRTECNNGFVRLWVEDNGIGMAKDEQAKLFTLFTRLRGARDYEGSGVGLAVVRRAVRKMGGSVGVESETGKGSRFWIDLKPA